MERPPPARLQRACPLLCKEGAFSFYSNSSLCYIIILNYHVSPSLQRRGIKGVVGMSNYKTSPSPLTAGLPPPFVRRGLFSFYSNSSLCYIIILNYHVSPSLQRRGIKGVVGMNFMTSPSPPSAGLPPPL